MKKLALSFLFSILPYVCFAQNPQIDHLKQLLATATNDTSRVLILRGLVDSYRFTKPDSAFLYAEKALALARKSNYQKGEALILDQLAGIFRIQGDIAKSLEYRYKALQIMEEKVPSMNPVSALNGMGLTYLQLNDYPKALSYFRKTLQITENANPEAMINMARIFRQTSQLDSAWYYLQKVAKRPELANTINSSVLMVMGDVQFELGNRRRAFDYLHQGVKQLSGDDRRIASDIYFTLSQFYKTANRADSSIYYAEKSLAEATSIGYQRRILDASDKLAEFYEPTDKAKALRFQKTARFATNELYGPQKVQALQKTIVNEFERQTKIEAEKIAYQNQLKQYAFLVGLGIVLLIAFLLFRNNRQKQKANLLLQQQKEEIERQRAKAEQALSDLKATQNQLIQSEKMASLGELTAGIAHEIQNPLNFVNNFSEVSAELMEELEDEIDKGDTEEAKALVGDLRQNLQKITQHGGRASAIVKGMLEHSRSSTGKKEPTDLNELTDEYLRLTYHGFQAKDNGFNAELVTEFDPGLSKINVMPQEIGRVLLNLFNNAFYAVREKQKTAPDDYQPTIKISTRQFQNRIEIQVKDNGSGIPDLVKQKIFQPFFTTKPTGQGTGLGLSISYDIVVKGHNGEMTVESIVGQSTSMIIRLPVI